MVYGWLLVSALVIIGLVVIFKSQDFTYSFYVVRKYLAIFFSIGLVVFLVFSIFNVAKNNDLSFTSVDGITAAAKTYFLWFRGIFSNVGKVTGYAINQDWLNTTVEDSDKEEKKTGKK